MEKKIAAFDENEVRHSTWIIVGIFTPIVVSVFVPIWWIRAILVIPMAAFMMFSIWLAWFKDPTVVHSDECANLVIFGKRPEHCKGTPYKMSELDKMDQPSKGFKFGDF